MTIAGEKIYQWDKQPRMPVPAPPRGSCDCQFHIYVDGDATLLRKILVDNPARLHGFNT